MTPPAEGGTSDKEKALAWLQTGGAPRRVLAATAGPIEVWSTNLPAVECFRLCQMDRLVVGQQGIRFHYIGINAREVLAAMTTCSIPRADRPDTARRVGIMATAAANYLNSLKS